MNVLVDLMNSSMYKRIRHHCIKMIHTTPWSILGKQVDFRFSVPTPLPHTGIELSRREDKVQVVC